MYIYQQKNLAIALQTNLVSILSMYLNGMYIARTYLTLVFGLEKNF